MYNKIKENKSICESDARVMVCITLHNPNSFEVYPNVSSTYYQPTFWSPNNSMLCYAEITPITNYQFLVTFIKFYLPLMCTLHSSS